jgi:hypothetical protein
MKEQFINFETAKLAKEKEFNWKTLYYLTDNSNADDLLQYSVDSKGNVYGWNVNSPDEIVIIPTQSILEDWLREKHNIIIIIHPHYDNFGEFSGWELIKVQNFITRKKVRIMAGYEIYHEAREVGLQEALKLIG